MSTDYSFYALLCGYMPRPERVQKSGNRKVPAFFVVCKSRRTMLIQIATAQSPLLHRL